MSDWNAEDEWDDDTYDDDGPCDDGPAETVTCPNCGADVYEEADMCPECGDFMIPGQSIWKERSPLFLAIWFLGIVAVIIALLGVYSMF